MTTATAPAQGRRRLPLLSRSRRLCRWYLLTTTVVGIFLRRAQQFRLLGYPAMSEPVQGFATIPRSLLHDGRAPRDAKLVYLIISSHVGGNVSAWPSHRRMAQLLGMSLSTVKRQLAWLEKHGYVAVERRQTEDGAWLTNEYQLRAGSASSPVSGHRSQGAYSVQEEPTQFRETPPPSLPENPGVGSDRATNESHLNESHKRSVRLPPNMDEIFDRFWEIYPRREGKGAAKAAFAKVLRRGVTVETVLAGATRLRTDPNLPERQYVCHPATWLNQGRWEDDPLPPRNEERSPAVNGRAGAVQHSPFLGVDSYQ